VQEWVHPGVPWKITSAPIFNAPHASSSGLTMTHKLSLILLGGSGSKIRQIHFSRKQFIVFAFFLLLGLAAVGYGLVDYVSVRSEAAEKTTFVRLLAHQNEEVVLQRQQLQRFAQEINELKERIVALDEFEERIRILANIDQADKQEGLFGVGGSFPEDLNAAADLTQSHHQLIRGMHQQVQQLSVASLNQETNFSSLVEKLEERKNILAHTPAIRPAQGWVTSGFEYRQNPFTGRREFHRGMDIANRKGTPVVATADGVVSFVGESGGLGIMIVIDHGYGFNTRYAHLQEGLKKRGERVRRGEVIARMGNTGRSTGPHLHYEVRLNGVPVNPDNYILN
jgi:murein DD-endopeptidase MepM/ murein hydrolase activator NlpD